MAPVPLAKCKRKIHNNLRNRDSNRLSLITEKISTFVNNPSYPHLQTPYSYSWESLRNMLFEIALIRRSNYEYYIHELNQNYDLAITHIEE